MKFKIETKKLLNILEKAMVKKGVWSLIPTPQFSFLESKIIGVNSNNRNDIASVMVIKSDHFEEYESKAKKIIPFEMEIYEALNEGFKNPTEFTEEENVLYGDDGVDKLKAELPEPQENTFPLPITPTQYGLIPDIYKYKAKEVKDNWSEEDTLGNMNVYKTTADALELPKRDEYTISLKNGVLTATMPKTISKVSHKIEGESIRGKKGHFIIDGKFYQNIVENLSGDVYIIFDNNHAIFTQSTDDIKLSYAAATRVINE